jgi:elongation factor Ts
MANITAADVAKLRKQTGAGMMDCKKALQENDGDFEKAIEYLRKKGAKVAAKRADKEASEGYVVAKTTDDKTYGVLLMVNCETDFVGKSEAFVNFVRSLADLALAHEPSNIEEMKALKLGDVTVAEALDEMVGKTGEKMEFEAFATIEAPSVYGYNHLGNKIGTLVGLNKSGIDGIDEKGHDIAMQIAAMNPIAIDKKDVTQETIDKEIEIGKELARQEGKPENLLEKIAQGRLAKFFKENTLLNQEFIKDSKLTVGQYLRQADKDLTVVKFYRFALGA